MLRSLGRKTRRPLFWLFAGKTKSGNMLWPYWWCFLFGGSYCQDNGGYAWTPGVYRLTRRYYKEGWKKAGYTWAEFVGLRKRSWDKVFKKRVETTPILVVVVPTLVERVTDL